MLAHDGCLVYSPNILSYGVQHAPLQYTRFLMYTEFSIAYTQKDFGSPDCVIIVLTCPINVWCVRSTKLNCEACGPSYFGVNDTMGSIPCLHRTITEFLAFVRQNLSHQMSWIRVMLTFRSVDLIRHVLISIGTSSRSASIH